MCQWPPWQIFTDVSLDAGFNHWQKRLADLKSNFKPKCNNPHQLDKWNEPRILSFLVWKNLLFFFEQVTKSDNSALNELISGLDDVTKGGKFLCPAAARKAEKSNSLVPTMPSTLNELFMFTSILLCRRGNKSESVSSGEHFAKQQRWLLPLSWFPDNSGLFWVRGLDCVFHPHTNFRQTGKLLFLPKWPPTFPHLHILSVFLRRIINVVRWEHSCRWKG